MCNNYCFSTAAMVTRTRLSVTLFVHCLNCYRRKGVCCVLLRRADWFVVTVQFIFFLRFADRVSQYISVFNQLDAQNLFYNNFYFMPLHVSSTCAHHQGVKIVLHSLWYHHTCRWPSRAPVYEIDFRLSLFNYGNAYIRVIIKKAPCLCARGF
jgi:hypothetical protein